jgi:hypothetical protein
VDPERPEWVVIEAMVKVRAGHHMFLSIHKTIRKAVLELQAPPKQMGTASVARRPHL